MEWYVAFSTAFVVIALAELGDKTQILAIVLASKYRRVPVLLGLMASLTLLSLIAVLGGAVIFKYVPVLYIRAVAGVAFILFAVWTFIEKDGSTGDEDPDEKRGKRKKKTGFMIFCYCFALIFIAELGDKTQLSTILLSSNLSEPFFVFLGAVAAFFVVDAPCVYIGKKLAEKVKVRYIKLGSGVLFMVLGIFFLLEVAGIL